VPSLKFYELSALTDDPNKSLADFDDSDVIKTNHMVLKL
jgi:hypothetical protein